MGKQQTHGKVTVVVGTQWGDEGKGATVDRLSDEADVVVRYHGGPNAGHTLVVGGKTYKLHQVPSAIVRPEKVSIVGPYVTCDPQILATELALADRLGTKVLVDERAPVILSIHRAIDAAREEAAGASAIGTTKSGVGPCYEDLISRRGPHLSDLASVDLFSRALRDRGFYAERAAVLRSLGVTPPTFDEMVDEVMPFARQIVPCLSDTVAYVAERYAHGAHILGEGAHGIMLDWLTAWPYCTSSFCLPAAFSASMGIPRIDYVIGVAKGYSTRVGEGPFPTELHDGIGDTLRERGKEYGTKTGRPRRCGWIDLAQLGYACRIAGVNEIVLTKLDVLSGLEQIGVCTRYIPKDVTSISRTATLTNELLKKVQPNIVMLDGWQASITDCRDYSSLPPKVRAYVAVLQTFLDIPITAIGVGPDRKQMIKVKH